MNRTRNPRGQGGKLRDDILAAATSILEESGSEEAVTLRAVARRASITAPSIYAHFEDRDAVIEAVLDSAFSDLSAAILHAMEAERDPVDRLHAGCLAYLDFARDRPHRYRTLFGRRRDLPALGFGGDVDLAGERAGELAAHLTEANNSAQTLGTFSVLVDHHAGLQAAIIDPDTSDDASPAPGGVADGESDMPPPGILTFGLLVGSIQACIDAGRSSSQDAFTDATALWSAMHGLATLHQSVPDFPWPDLSSLKLTVIDRLAVINSKTT